MKIKNKKYITGSAEESQKLGADFAKNILNLEKKENAVVIGLEGDLGSGKTTFLQGFAKGLGIKEKILSPTFVIMKRFKIPGGKNFIHIDTYRINKPEEILEIGFEEIIKNPENIVAIEWPEKIKKYLPKETIFIKFKYIYPEPSRRVEKEKREIVFI